MTRVMSCHKYRLSQVSLFLCLVMLMSTMRRVHTHTTCINNATPLSEVTLNCTHPPGRIEVLSLLYAEFQNQTQPQTCPGSVQEAKCSQIMERGSLLKNNIVFKICSSIHNSCSGAIKRVAEAEEHHSCSTYNYFLANYTCVEDTEIMDLCGDETRNLTLPTHLGHFSSWPVDPIKNCTCMVQEGSHQLIAVDVAMPQTAVKNCPSNSVKVVWSPSDGGTNRSQIIINESNSFTNQYLVNNSDITWIYYTKNCTRITQPVWFKLQPVGRSQATIYCGKSIPNSAQITPTLVSQSSNTTPEWTTLTSVPSHTITGPIEVIVGSVIGGFFVVVIAVVLVIVLYRWHKSRKHTQSHHPLSNGANTVRYENTSVDLPLVAMGASPHTTGYDYIAAVGIVQGDENSDMYINTGNVHNHTADEREYDHIQTAAVDDTNMYDKLYLYEVPKEQCPA